MEPFEKDEWKKILNGLRPGGNVFVDGREKMVFEDVRGRSKADYFVSSNPGGVKGPNRSHSGNRVLDSLSREMVGAIAPFIQMVALDKKQVISQEEGVLNVVCFPLTAVISEFRTLEDGRTVEIAVTGNEGAVGLSSVLSGSHISPNLAEASQPGFVITICVSKLEGLLQSERSLRLTLGRHTIEYIAQISQKAICNMYHSAKARLCTWLLLVQDRSGQKQMSLTHEHLARILGVNRPSLSRIAHELRDDRSIDYSRGSVAICDRERLKESACSCYLERGRNIRPSIIESTSNGSIAQEKYNYVQIKKTFQERRGFRKQFVEQKPE